MTLKNAIELSIIKWKWIVKNDGSEGLELEKDHPELKDMQDSCGLCEYYRSAVVNRKGSRFMESFKECIKCPLYEYGDGCTISGSLYDNWYEATCDDEKKTAQAMLDTLIEILNKL